MYKIFVQEIFIQILHTKIIYNEKKLIMVLVCVFFINSLIVCSFIDLI